MARDKWKAVDGWRATFGLVITIGMSCIAGQLLIAPIVNASQAEVALDFIETNYSSLSLPSSFADLVQVGAIHTPVGIHLRFRQYDGGIPVARSLINVTLDTGGNVIFVTANYFSEFDLPTSSPAISEDSVRSIVAEIIGERPTNETSIELVGFRDAEDDDHLAWYLEAEGPLLEFSGITIDALTGETLDIRSRVSRATGWVFSPDPITAGQDSSCVLAVPPDCDVWDPPVQERELHLLDPPDAASRYRVKGTYAFSRLFPPTTSCPFEPCDPGDTLANEANGGDFHHTRDNPFFEEVNTYYHITKLAMYLVNELGCEDIESLKVSFDAHNHHGICATYFKVGNEHRIYLPTGDEYDSTCAYVGSYVEAGEDQDIIIHEYTHAIVNHLNEGIWSASDQLSMLNEGFANYFAASYRIALEEEEEICPSFTRDTIGPWFARTNPNALHVYLNKSYHYPEALSSGISGLVLWASTLMEIEESIGRSATVRIALSSAGMLTEESNMQTAADALIQAASALLTPAEVGPIVRVLARRGFVELLRGTISTSVSLVDCALVTGDLKITSDGTLSVENSIRAGRVFAPVLAFAADYDSSNLGQDAGKVELIVDGELIVNGAGANPIVLTSAGHPPAAPGSLDCYYSAIEPAEGDWWGVSVTGSGTGALEHAILAYSDWGIVLGSANSNLVKACTLNNNALWDIRVGATSTQSSVIDNHVTVEGGSGLEVAAALIVSGNSISSNGSSGHGVVVPSNAASPTIAANSIAGASQGAGVNIMGGTAIIRENAISENKWGIRIEAGAPQIGTTNTASDNTIRENTTGVLATCAGGGTCPSGCSVSAPVIRNNQIYDNLHGVVREKKAQPNLGTNSSSDPGLNSIYDNSTYCIWNKTTCDTVPAKGNWLGGDCSAAPTCTSGLLNISGYLCSQPNSSKSPSVDVSGLEQLGYRVISISHPPVGAPLVVRFESGGPEQLTLRVHDILGRTIRSVPIDLRAGIQDVLWDGSNSRGAKVASGIYLLSVGDSSGLQRGLGKVLWRR